MPIVDTHLHVGLREQMPPTVPAIRRGHPIEPVESLLPLMDAFGVDKAILVQIGNWADNTYITRCVVEHPGRFGAVVHLDETDPASVATLESLADGGHICGIRLGCRLRMPGGDPLALWRKAAELDLVVSASANIVDHFTTGLDEVLGQLPELRVKIEHLARPDIDEKPPYSRFRRMLKLARFPNTYLNIDGFYAFRYPTENDPEGTPVVNAPPYDPYLPFVRLACDAFGPHRLMWGSDFPFTLKVNGYSAGLPFICHSCGFLTAEEKELILGKTAMRVYAL